METHAAGSILETARLILRPFGTEDLEILHSFFDRPEVRRFLWDDRRIGRDTVQGLIEASLASFSEHGFGQWLAEDRRSRALIGFCGLRSVDETPEIEILYALVGERWGLGLATEAANAVLSHAFLRLGLRRVVGRTDSPNLASVRVLERLGMHFEGEHVVHACPTLHYSLTKAAFQARDAIRAGS